MITVEDNVITSFLASFSHFYTISCLGCAVGNMQCDAAERGGAAPDKGNSVY